jgi:uncharacterized membrane protein
MKRLVRWFFTLAFVSIGVLHFTRAELFVSIMPAYLPAHRELVYLSGAFEILGGVGLMIPSLRRWAGWGLMALLLAVFPANVYMAMHPDAFIAKGIPLWGLYARLPVQFLLIYTIWWAVRSEKPRPEDSA